METVKGTVVVASQLVIMLVLSVGLLGIGMLKIVGFPDFVELFQQWGLPLGFMYGSGIFEIIMSIAIFNQPTRKFTYLICLVYILGILTFHIVSQELEFIPGPLLVILLSGIGLLLEIYFGKRPTRV